MTTRVKVSLGIAVFVIGVVAWGLLTWPEAIVGQLHGGSVNLATCRIVEANQLANDRRPDESDPTVAPVPAPFQLFACNVLFPNQQALTWNNPGAIGGYLVIGAIGTWLYLRHRRRKIRSPG